MSKIIKTSGDRPLVVFFGSGPVAAASLKFLAGHFNIEVVITKSVPAHHHLAAPVEQISRSKNINILFANTKDELDKLIKNNTFQSRVGLIVDYGVIVSQATISAFELGIVNSHFSLLPQWRGADPITFSILSGQPKTGVSLMLIEPALDTGKLLVQKGLKIADNETTPTLTNKLIQLSNLLLTVYLPKYITGDIKPRVQSHPNRATYSRKLTKDDGTIDWHKPAQQIEREVRAYLGWPGSRTEIAGKEVIITQAHVVSNELHPDPQEAPKPFQTPDGLIGIPSLKQGVLIIDRLKPAGKPEMTAQAFLAGYRHLLDS